MASSPKSYDKAPEMAIDQTKQYSATIQTNLGDIVVALHASEAPRTVNNFVFLARDGFYDGAPFHRVIKSFMAQTGDPTGTGTGGPGYKFADEKVTRKYVRGTVAMANAGPNTNGSQFFIVDRDAALPPAYTIFGQVTEGLDTLDKIMNTPTGAGKGGPDTPKSNVTIQTISVQES